jgi:hypothetical protein
MDTTINSTINPEKLAGWGGARPGAGKKRQSAELLHPVSVTLPPEMIERLKIYGDGNVSAGLRQALEIFFSSPLSL